ncbi:unnamed protein product [Closterium sp. Naga37s-1]|nr:unnamed protein product [Closterium sp. Naga37s-1]
MALIPAHASNLWYMRFYFAEMNLTAKVGDRRFDILLGSGSRVVALGNRIGLLGGRGGSGSGSGGAGVGAAGGGAANSAAEAALGSSSSAAAAAAAEASSDFDILSHVPPRTALIVPLLFNFSRFSHGRSEDLEVGVRTAANSTLPAVLSAVELFEVVPVSLEKEEEEGEEEVDVVQGSGEAESGMSDGGDAARGRVGRRCCAAARRRLDWGEAADDRSASEGGAATRAAPEAAVVVRSKKRISVHVAAREGDVEALRDALTVRPGAINERQLPVCQTPLHLAVAEGHLEALRFLLDWRGSCGGAEVKADVEARNMFGETPVHVAAKSSNADAIRLLLRAGARADVAATNGMTPVHLAVWAAVQSASSNTGSDTGSNFNCSIAAHPPSKPLATAESAPEATPGPANSPESAPGSQQLAQQQQQHLTHQADPAVSPSKPSPLRHSQGELSPKPLSHGELSPRPLSPCSSRPLSPQPLSPQLLFPGAYGSAFPTCPPPTPSSPTSFDSLPAAAASAAANRSMFSPSAAAAAAAAGCAAGAGCGVANGGAAAAGGVKGGGSRGCGGGVVAAVAVLLEANADPCAVDKDGNTPMALLPSRATRCSVCREVQALLQRHISRRTRLQAELAVHGAKLVMDQLEKELSSLVGLHSLKQQLRTWGKGLLLDQRRRALGLPVPPRRAPHMAFLGSPGTGKTTVARVLARMLALVGVLPLNRVVEVQRTDLVGEYVGHTGPKTRRKIEEAEGGILFVDEAYRLMPCQRSEEKDYGIEALEEIMTVMDSGKLVVIFAGYAEPMQRVFEANEGFKRRVTKCFTFDDLSPSEIARVMLLKMGYGQGREQGRRDVQREEQGRLGGQGGEQGRWVGVEKTCVENSQQVEEKQIRQKGDVFGRQMEQTHQGGGVQWGREIGERVEERREEEMVLQGKQQEEGADDRNEGSGQGGECSSLADPSCSKEALTDAIMVHTTTKQRKERKMEAWRLHSLCSEEGLAEAIIAHTTEKQRKERNGGMAVPVLLDARDHLDLRLPLDCCCEEQLMTIHMHDIEAALGMLPP